MKVLKLYAALEMVKKIDLKKDTRVLWHI